MKISSLLFLALIPAFCTNALAQTAEPRGKADTARTMYMPAATDPGAGAMYPRVIELKEYKKGRGDLLATFELYIRGKRYFPIYRSTDQGETWSLYSKVEDTHNNWGMRFQPQLFELPEKTGEFPAGTIFCAGSSIPDDNSKTELLLYQSQDGGKTWSYVSSIVSGGRAVYNSSPTATETPVWEPFLGLDKSGRLVYYYSDERYKSKGFLQLLAHKVSEDGGKTWGEEVFDVAIPDLKTRPGMAVITRLPNKQYFMVYEMVGIPNVPVYYRYSDDGISWGDPADFGTRIVDKDSVFLKSTPYVEWSPAGGKNGTLIVSSMAVVKNGTLSGGSFMINKNLGKGLWTLVDSPVKYNAINRGGYSQAILVLNKGKELLQVVPVPLAANPRQNAIQYSKMKLD